MVRPLKDESGYSLVEVMVAIMLLAIAIIPMVGMFDAGLRAATEGGNYDTARALANAKMEEVRALSYNNLVAKYPPGTYTVDTDPALKLAKDTFRFPGLSFWTIRTDYVNTSLGSDSGASPSSSNGMRIEVTVGWNGATYERCRSGMSGSCFTTTGLKTRGQPA